MKFAGLLLSLPFSLLVFACSSSSNGSNVVDSGPPAGDAGGSTVAEASADAGTPEVDADAGPGTDAAVATTYLRFANLAPDAPALDLCVSAADGEAWIGPLLGATHGIAYPQASAYLPLAAADSYGVRIVAAGAKSCDVAIDGNEQNLPTLAGGQHTTIAVEGDLSVVGADEAFGLNAYIDDDASSGSDVELRFINASASLGPVDFGKGSLAAATFAPLFTATGMAAEGDEDGTDAGAIDYNGYVALAAPNAQIMSAHVTGATSDAVTASAVSSGSGSVLTMFLIGGKTNDAAHPTQLLLCDENAAPVGGLESCKIASP